MKILLLNPSYSDKKLSVDPILTRCTGVPSKAPYIWPPIGLAYIASALREFSSADAKIEDARVDDFQPGMAMGFDLVVINSGTPTINQDLQLSHKIKDLNGPMVALMGVHAAYFHKDVAKYCDFVVRGEPDTVLVNLANSLDKGGDFNKVRGITWNDEKNKIHVNKNEKPAEDMDKFPFQAIEILSKKYYDILTKRKPIAFLITSRGCTFRCTFCSAKFYSRQYRYRSAENVIGEIKYLMDKGFRDFTFFDDSFTINKKRVMDICDIMKKERLDATWRCLSRVDTIDKEMLAKMKDAGCYQMQFGLESGDNRMLELMKKGTNADRIRKTFSLCDKAGIETVGFFIFGYPGETLQSINSTIKMANTIKPDFVTFNLFTPLPGSEIFESVPRKEWENYDFTSTSFCNISSDKMNQFIGEAYRSYYLRPSYILRRIIKTRQPARIVKQNLDFWRKRSGVLWEFIRH